MIPRLDSEILRRGDAIAGFRVIEAAAFCDERGSLDVVEFDPLHFIGRRTFLIRFGNAPVGTARADHATSCSQILFPLRGAFQLELDNGTQRHAVTAAPGPNAFYVSAGVWRRIVNLKTGTELMVVADAPYASTRYFPSAVPGLVRMPGADGE